MKVQYHGPHDAVVLSGPEWREVARGEVLDVPDELGARLLDQASNWRIPRTKGAAAPAAEGDTNP